jgi:hypothetical protein
LKEVARLSTKDLRSSFAHAIKNLMAVEIQTSS